VFIFFDMNIHKGYVKALRRAFLLRIHPDRFRQHPNKIRKEQASLVQAIEEWISSPPVLAFCHGKQQVCSNHYYYYNSPHPKEYSYHLEQNDGKLTRHILTLDAPIIQVLQGMAASLTELGVNLPSFPTIPVVDARQLKDRTTSMYDDQGKSFYKMDPFSEEASRDTHASMYDHMFRFVWSSHNPFASTIIDEQFDIVSRQGKNLTFFLQQLQPKDIVLRKQQRLAAVASALVVRRAYQFQAVDGTGIGWSSASVTKCFHSLTKLFDEHRHRFHVTSFYPLRLELSKDERQSKLCVHGAKLYINPLDTPLQWLNTFRLVTPETLNEVKFCQDNLTSYTKSVQTGAFGGYVKMKRGHSCSSAEYHACMKRLASHHHADHQSIISATTFLPDDQPLLELALCRDSSIQVIVESSQSPRMRGAITHEGHIRVSSNMEPGDIVLTIAKLAQKAQQAMVVESQLTRECDELVKQLILLWNLDTIHIKVSHSPITTTQALSCLRRLRDEASSADSSKSSPSVRHDVDWRQHLEGHSVSISSSGQFCHVGDDGSIIIPWDYR